MKKRGVFSFVDYSIFNHVLFEKHTKNLTFQIFLGENIFIMFLRIFLLYVFRILFNNDPQQISINSAKKMAKEIVPKHEF